VREARRRLGPRQVVEEVPGALLRLSLGAQHRVGAEARLDRLGRVALQLAVEVGDQVGPLAVAQG
jgi:hypothetical protein